MDKETYNIDEMHEQLKRGDSFASIYNHGDWSFASYAVIHADGSIEELQESDPRVAYIRDALEHTDHESIATRTNKEDTLTTWTIYFWWKRDWRENVTLVSITETSGNAGRSDGG